MLSGADTLQAAIRHFAYPLDESFQDARRLLCFTGYLPIIDKFHLLRRVSCQTERFSTLEDYLRSGTPIKDREIHDLFNLCFPKERMLGASELTSVEKRLVELQNSIRSGDAATARELATTLSAQDPELFEALDIAISLDASGGEPPRASPLYDVIQTVKELTKGERSERASMGDLRKIAFKIPSRNLRYYLANRCYLSRDSRTMQAPAETFEIHGRFSYLLYESPAPSKERRELVVHYEALQEAYSKRPAILAAESWMEAGAVITALGFLAEATRLRFHKQTSDALAILNQIVSRVQFWNKLPPGTKITIRRALAELLLATGRVDEAISNAAEVLLGGGILDHVLGKNLIETVIRSIDQRLHSKTYSGILVACLGAPAKQIYPVFDNFLSAFNTDNVEVLIGNARCGVHFNEWLELVCILPVLARSPIYTSTIEAENARIRLCQHLIRVDHNVAKLTAEIAELTQKQLIRKGVANVRRSKIYVDESGIRRSSATTLREKFHQFVESKKTTGANALKLFDAAQLSLYLPNADGDLVPQRLETSAFEKDNVRILTHGHFLMFRSLFLEVRNQFVSSNNYGLDSYLSIRIRHGTLQGQLRSPFETHHLILQRLAPGHGYAESDYWPSRLGLDVLDGKRTELHFLFSQFSRDIDAEIVSVKDQMIHVSTEEKKRQGLFDYSYTDAELLAILDAKFDDVVNYDQFIDRTFLVLWQKTLGNLATVRATIESQTAPRLRETLSRLEVGLRGVFVGEGQELFQAVTRAYPALNNALDTVSDWFQPSSQATPEALEAAVIADVALASYRNIHPGRPFIDSITGEKSHLMHGRVCSPIYDVVAALIDNAFVHSRLSPESADVRVEFSFTQEKISFTVGSNVASGTSVADSVAIVKRAASRFMSASNESALISEGGTGLPKLLKILREDLSRAHIELDAHQEGARRIKVVVTIESEGLIL